MDALKAILTRSSIRRYTQENVSEDTVAELLRAGMSAPSANNKQPWHFVIIRNKDTMNKIMEVHPYSKMLKDAPVCIAVCADTVNYGDTEYWVQDLSACTENILLAAHSLGLGSVWLGVYPSNERTKEIKEVLNLPENITPLNLISIGHPAEERNVSDRFDETRIHKEIW